MSADSSPYQAEDVVGSQGEVELDVPAEPEYLGVARAMVSALASGRRSIETQRVHDLELAVSEACTNAIEAYGAPRPTNRVRIRWREFEDAFEVEVEDHGPGFDVDGIRKEPPVGDLDLLEVQGGLGIPLIRALVDDVSFTPSSEGTSVSMVMRCGRARRCRLGPSRPDLPRTGG